MATDGCARSEIVVQTVGNVADFELQKLNNDAFAMPGRAWQPIKSRTALTETLFPSNIDAHWGLTFLPPGYYTIWQVPHPTAAFQPECNGEVETLGLQTTSFSSCCIDSVLHHSTIIANTAVIIEQNPRAFSSF